MAVSAKKTNDVKSTLRRRANLDPTGRLRKVVCQKMRLGVARGCDATLALRLLVVNQPQRTPRTQRSDEYMKRSLVSFVSSVVIRPKLSASPSAAWRDTIDSRTHL